MREGVRGLHRHGLGYDGASSPSETLENTLEIHDINGFRPLFGAPNHAKALRFAADPQDFFIREARAVVHLDE